ncbi:MAG TPA: hypothetical protein VKS25_01935, partial [Solirubrobacteraceae bacterium]|nr:hypothetical protein [Solirubrobacteraceae bacterium]
RVGGTGRGPTKQAAEQAAAHDALDKLSKIARGGAAAAAGAARDAAKTVASEPARVRRRVAEVAADRGATPRRRRGRSGSKPVGATEATADVSSPKRSRSLLSALRHAAEALVGRQQAPPPEPPAAAPAPRRRRGRRGGRGRGGGSTPPVEG